MLNSRGPDGGLFRGRYAHLMQTGAWARLQVLSGRPTAGPVVAGYSRCWLPADGKHGSTSKTEYGRVIVPKGFLFLLLALVITIVVTHLSLWLRGVRPSKRAGLWEWMSWEVFPKDEQTKSYLLQRFWTTALVMPVTIAILWILSER